MASERTPTDGWRGVWSELRRFFANTRRNQRRSWKKADGYAKALAIMGLVAVAGGALTATLLIQETHPARIDDTPLAAWATFFTVFGIIYAIVAGLLLAELLARHHKLSSIVEEEVNAVEDVRDLLVYVDQQDAEKRVVFHRLCDYVESVVETEWPDMLDPATATKTDTSDALYEVMVAVEPLQVTDPSDQAALQAIIARIGDITTQRTKRLEMARQPLSPAIQLLVIFMSLTVIAGFVLVPVGNLWVQGFMVLTGAIAVYLLLVVILDLHHPYRGLWNITNDPFVEVLMKMRKGPPVYPHAPREVRRCEHCWTSIHPKATRCPSCTSLLPPAVQPAAASG